MNPAKNKENSTSYPISYKISNLFLCLILISTCYSAFSQTNLEKATPIEFELFYETLHPLALKNATFFIAPDKLLGRSDSVKMQFPSDALFQDTLYLTYPWKFPVHAWVKLEYASKILISNKFYLDPSRGKWIITISDTAAYVKAIPKYSFVDKESYMGMVILFQTLLELILASLIVRFFRWPAWVIIIVLVSNLAAFPIYSLKLQPAYLSDILILLIKFLVILLTGKKRLGIVRIIILVLTISIISYGFKEILILISKVI